MSPSPSHLSLSLLLLSQSPQYRSVRQFQTSAPSRKVNNLRPDPYNKTVNEAALKSFSAAAPRASPKATPRPLLNDEKRSSSPDQVRWDVQKRAQAAAAQARARIAAQEQEVPQQGSLADNSLFADPQQTEDLRQTDRPTALSTDRTRGLDPAALELRNPSRLAAAINPEPKARSMWQRRMVIRSVRQRGRLTKAVKLARAERLSLSRSHFFKTSMKKLAPLARQIAGKPIDEAILQMRFSKKKVAKEVREHLIQAKHEAIVARGMGLGHLEETQQLSKPNSTPATPESFSLTTVQAPEASPPTPTLIPSPKPHYLPGTTIPSNPALRPPTSIYISQAWINRGPYGESPDYRAFGRMNIMRPPNTGLSVLLREEKTRAREKAEKEVKAIRRRMGKNMWTQLPDRKVTRQGQYLLW